MFYLAVEAVNCNAEAETRLFEHIRNLLIPGHEPDCNGTLSSRGHAQAIGALALVKSRPALWNRLSMWEKEKISVLVEGCLAATATTSSDHGDFAGGLDGCGDFSKHWSPNFKEGFIGELIAASLFFGPAEASGILDNFDCRDYIGRARALGLNNLVKIFEETTEGISCKKGYGPKITCRDIERVVNNYTYQGHALTDPAAIHRYVTELTFNGGTVACGIPRPGQAVTCSRYISGQKGELASGCTQLPNTGHSGMLTEFNACDGGGLRSSLSYSGEGWSNNTMTSYLLDHFGYPPLPAWLENRVRIGTADLFYKAEHGYYSYANGKSQGLVNADSMSYGYKYSWALKNYFPTARKGACGRAP